MIRKDRTLRYEMSGVPAVKLTEEIDTEYNRTQFVYKK